MALTGEELAPESLAIPEPEPVAVTRSSKPRPSQPQSTAILATDSTYPARGRTAVYVPKQVEAMLPRHLAASEQLEVRTPAPRALLRHIALDQRYAASPAAAVSKAPSVPTPAEAREAEAAKSPWTDFFEEEKRRGGADPDAVTPAGMREPLDDGFETEGPPLPPGWNDSRLPMPLPAALTLHTNLAVSRALALSRES